MAVSNGAEYIKGTFTVPDNAENFTLNYGKSFSKYLLYIEMTDASKTALNSSAESGSTAIMFLAVYPPIEFKQNINDNTRAIKVTIYNPSTDTIGTTTLGASLYSVSSFTDAVRLINSAGQTRLIRGYSYDYVIVSLDNI